MASYGEKPADRSAQTASSTVKAGTISTSSINAGGLFSRQPAPAQLSVPQKDLLVFFRQLSVILQSGVAIAQGMVLIAENQCLPCPNGTYQTQVCDSDECENGRLMFCEEQPDDRRAAASWCAE